MNSPNFFDLFIHLFSHLSIKGFMRIFSIPRQFVGPLEYKGTHESVLAFKELQA